MRKTLSEPSPSLCSSIGYWWLSLDYTSLFFSPPLSLPAPHPHPTPFVDCFSTSCLLIWAIPSGSVLSTLLFLLAPNPESPAFPMSLASTSTCMASKPKFSADPNGILVFPAALRAFPFVAPFVAVLNSTCLKLNLSHSFPFQCSWLLISEWCAVAVQGPHLETFDPFEGEVLKVGAAGMLEPPYMGSWEPNLKF